MDESVKMTKAEELADRQISKDTEEALHLIHVRLKKMHKEFSEFSPTAMVEKWELTPYLVSKLEKQKVDTIKAIEQFEAFITTVVYINTEIAYTLYATFLTTLYYPERSNFIGKVAEDILSRNNKVIHLSPTQGNQLAALFEALRGGEDGGYRH